MAIRSETELYEPVKQYFEKHGYEVKGEVNNCDLVAYHEEEDEPVIVELKKSFNLALLHQGIERLSMSKQVYLAVPLIRGQRRPVHLRWSNLTKLCRMLGLGLITVQFYKTKAPHVEILCMPEGQYDGMAGQTGMAITEDAGQTGQAAELAAGHAGNAGRQHVRRQVRRSSRKSNRLRTEFMNRSGDYNVGGSSQAKIVTAYRELALQCAFLIQEHEQLSPLQLRNLTGKQKVADILQKNYYGWFDRVQRGIYQLTPAGKQALHTYEHIIANNDWAVSATAQDD